jgi:transcriptional regulator with XRE-family HTH domain
MSLNVSLWNSHLVRHDATICHMVTRKRLNIADIGRRLAARREQLGLDQEEVAGRAGVSRPYISRLERGIVPNPKLLDLEQVASSLDLPLTALVRPESSPRELFVAEGVDILEAAANEPPELQASIINTIKSLMDIAQAARLARSN